MKNILNTGQFRCYDHAGCEISCRASGQDGEYGYGSPWQEALDAIAVMNQGGFLGFADWRLPNRRELRSLMSYQTRKPSLSGRCAMAEKSLLKSTLAATILIHDDHGHGC